MFRIIFDVLLSVRDGPHAFQVQHNSWLFLSNYAFLGVLMPEEAAH